MLFTEAIFLLIFLPATVVLHLGLGSMARNASLLLISLFFYIWGETLYVAVLLAVVVVNYFAALLIEKYEGKLRTSLLIAGVVTNVVILFYFKYMVFALTSFGFNAEDLPSPHLPLGISFFTFQGISYLADVASGKVKSQKRFQDLALYICCFPQLIAGPIVRYSEIESSIGSRKITNDDISVGAWRFAIGLSKKVLIADPLSVPVDAIFGAPEGSISPAVAWLAVMAYTLQLYFDFSGYSDMAIGLGRMLGFRFPENFNYPFVAKTVNEFWMRWHMTLSRFFRDYAFDKLGGLRKGKLRGYMNIIILFTLIGLWHGAAWNFLLWGFICGVLICAERIYIKRKLRKLPDFISHVYMFFLIIPLFLVFRSESGSQILEFLSSMFLLSSGEISHLHPVGRYFSPFLLMVMCAGIIFSLPVMEQIRKGLDDRVWDRHARRIKEGAFAAMLFVSLVSVAAHSYSPFLYFRF